MKVHIFLPGLLVVASVAKVNSVQEEKDRASITEQIRAALESVREVMVVGAPAQGVPVLDPLLLDLFHFRLDDVGAEGTLNASGVVVDNLSTFVVNYLQFSVLARRLIFDISVPTLLISAEHFDVDGSADDQEIKAIGDGTLELCEAQVSGSLRVKVSWSGEIQIYDVRLKFSMQSVKSQLNVKEDDGINDVLEEFIPAFVKSHQKEISDFLNPAVERTVNEFLLQDSLIRPPSSLLEHKILI